MKLKYKLGQVINVFSNLKFCINIFLIATCIENFSNIIFRHVSAGQEVCYVVGYFLYNIRMASVFKTPIFQAE